MIALKSQREIDGMQAAGDILAGLFHELATYIKPGMTTWILITLVTNTLLIMTRRLVS